MDVIKLKISNNPSGAPLVSWEIFLFFLPFPQFNFLTLEKERKEGREEGRLMFGARDAVVS